MSHGERLQAAAAEVSRLRAAREADPGERAWVLAVKAWQAQRLARTHRDLLADPRYRDAARFFLEDLYGPKDFAQRDAEMIRVVPMLVKLLPDTALATLADAVEVDALSERLDTALAGLLRERDPARIDDARYARAYREAGSKADRLHQIELVEGVGRSLDRLVRHPLIGRMLHMMGKPARVAGLSAMHDFLMRGFDAFRAMGGASEFLSRIETRERAILERLFEGRIEGWVEGA